MASALGAGLVLAACSSVLGFDSLTLLPGEGGTPSGEGGPQDGSTDGTAPDAEGGREAGPTCIGVDLTSDKKNCGRCNHDCLGGDCMGGMCKPILLADGLADAEGLVVDDLNVYVAENYLDRIARFGKNALGPCTKPPLPAICLYTATNVHRPTGMGIDANNVYWVNGSASEIRSCALKSCDGKTPNLVAATNAYAFDHILGNGLLPLELIVRDGQVFWPENGGSAIRSAPVGGGPVTTYLSNNSYAPVAIAVDDTSIYFTDDTNQHQTQIASVPRSGAPGAVKVVSESPARPYGIALNGTNDNLYWTVPFVFGPSDGLVHTAPKTQSGGPPSAAFATPFDEPRAIMVDANNVYWLLTGVNNAAIGVVLYCPIKGCPGDGPIVLASAQRVPKHLTQDATAIYWSNEGLTDSVAFSGQVYKIAKP